MAVSPSPDQQITGRVVGVNPKGVKLDGHPDWFNFSKFAPDLVPPARGSVVTLTLDRQGFVRAVQASDVESLTTSPRPSPGATSARSGPDLRELRIIRQSCLKSAVERAAGRPDVSTGDVIRIAEAFEQWVLRPHDSPELVDAF